MAKTFGPLHSDSASGTIADVLTFSQRASGNQCRYQKKQKDANSPAQNIQRVKFNLGLDLWTSMPSTEKNYWKIVESEGFVNI